MKLFLTISSIAIIAFSVACRDNQSINAVAPSTLVESHSTQVAPYTINLATSSIAMPGIPVTLAEGGTYWKITAKQLAFFTTKDYLVALVEDDTVYIGELSGTEIFVNIATINDELYKFPTDKNIKMILTCSSGTISPSVATLLVKNGYTRIMILDGGILGWYYSGYPIYDRQEGEPVFF